MPNIPSIGQFVTKPLPRFGLSLISSYDENVGQTPLRVNVCLLSDFVDDVKALSVGYYKGSRYKSPNRFLGSLC